MRKDVVVALLLILTSLFPALAWAEDVVRKNFCMTAIGSTRPPPMT